MCLQVFCHIGSKNTLAECRAELARAMLRRWCFSGEAQRTLFLSLFRREGGRPSAVASGAALLGFGSVGFEIRLLRVSGLTVRKIAFQMLIFTAVGLQIRPNGSLGNI